MSKQNNFGYVKVNIPDNIDEYFAGNGEGCYFVLTDQNARNDYDSGKHGCVHMCMLANYSMYWLGLKPGDVLPVEFRGNRRPVVPFSYLEQWAQGKQAM